jgi:hypothetical protein
MTTFARASNAWFQTPNNRGWKPLLPWHSYSYVSRMYLFSNYFTISLRSTDDAVTGDCGSEPAMTGLFLSLLRNLRRHSVCPFRHPGCGSGSAMTDPGSLRTCGDAATGDCGSEPAMTGLFLSLLRNLRRHSVCPFRHPGCPFRHPGCGLGSAMTDPGSLRTCDDAVTGDCGSEPAMTKRKGGSRERGVKSTVGLCT